MPSMMSVLNLLFRTCRLASNSDLHSGSATAWCSLSALPAVSDGHALACCSTLLLGACPIVSEVALLEVRVDPRGKRDRAPAL